MASNAEGYTLFAQLGPYAGVAGSCALVAVMPDYDSGFYSNVPGAAIGDVATFFHTGVGGWLQDPSVLVSRLISSDTNWNAHISPDGTLGVGVPQEVTNTQSTTAATSSAATTTTTPSAPGSCNLVKVKSGTVSCATALSVANAALATGHQNPNTTVTEQGFACYVYPYEVDCSGSAGSFSALYGTVGPQTP
jgi:hypothetical protein